MYIQHHKRVVICKHTPLRDYWIKIGYFTNKKYTAVSYSVVLSNNLDHYCFCVLFYSMQYYLLQYIKCILAIGNKVFIHDKNLIPALFLILTKVLLNLTNLTDFYDTDFYLLTTIFGSLFMIVQCYFYNFWYQSIHSHP